MGVLKRIKNKIKGLKNIIINIIALGKTRADGVVKRCGLKLHYTALINVDKPELIEVGRNCYVGPYALIYVNNYSKELNNSFLKIGEYTSIGEFSNVRACGGSITIGSKVQIAQNVNIIASNHEFKKGIPIREQEWSLKRNFVEIGDDVWIGCGTTILPGTKIGSGSVIGANSLVNGDIPDNVIAFGNPAKVIKDRQ